MEGNYKLFIDYLKNNEIRFDNNEAAKLVRFSYSIEVGTIEIVVDFEHEKRIGFFSFLNMFVTNERKETALELLNSFNESLNYGSIIISQTNQVVYKIMVTTFETLLKDEHWAEIIFRLWSISRDIFPLFGRIIFANENPEEVFDEFLKQKEKIHNTEVQPTHNNPDVAAARQNPGLWKDFRNWFLQN
ncbi:MAG: hypothetical protein Q4F97_04550 [Bacteroidales bacterium]|nr:hypothetical protein [Bacteroidales bacterium]